MKGDNGTNRIPRYCCPNHHRTSHAFRCCNHAIRIVSFLGCSPNVNSSWSREQRDGRFIWSYPASVSTCLMSSFCGRNGTPSFTHFSITFSNQRFSNCSPPVDVGSVKLTSDSFCGNMNIQFCCNLWCSSSVIFRNTPPQCRTISFCQYCNGFEQGVARQRLRKHSPTLNNRWGCVFYVVRATPGAGNGPMNS
jgi:hypothetical protein